MTGSSSTQANMSYSSLGFDNNKTADDLGFERLPTLCERCQISSHNGSNLSDPKSSAVSLSSKPKLEYGMFDVVLLDAVTPALTQCLLDR